MRLRVPNEFKPLVRSIRRKAKRNNVTLRFPVTVTIHQSKNDPGSAGYYGNNELAVAMDNEFYDWMTVLIHESCHMDQAFDKKLKERCEQWQKAYNNFYAWIEGNAQFNRIQLLHMVRLIIDCEKDCDQRAIAKIKKWHLPINTKRYIRESNVYLYGHYVIMDTRKWYNKIYTNWELQQAAPDHYNGDYSDIPCKLRKAIYKFIEEQEVKSVA